MFLPVIAAGLQLYLSRVEHVVPEALLGGSAPLAVAYLKVGLAWRLLPALALAVILVPPFAASGALRRQLLANPAAQAVGIVVLAMVAALVGAACLSVIRAPMPLLAAAAPLAIAYLGARPPPTPVQAIAVAAGCAALSWCYAIFFWALH